VCYALSLQIPEIYVALFSDDLRGVRIEHQLARMYQRDARERLREPQVVTDDVARPKTIVIELFGPPEQVSNPLYTSSMSNATPNGGEAPGRRQGRRTKS
jgi:hypothetical protein